MQTDPDGIEDVQRLFHEQVPEVANGTVEIKGIARERGHRSMILVHSTRPEVDPVSVCVGVRGERVKNVVRALSGEGMDIVRWSDSLKDLIQHTLAPIHVHHLEFDEPSRRAKVFIDGKHSRPAASNPVKVKLASRLVGWDLQLVEV